ncbi:MAG: hypothetical protein P8Y28_06600 [Gammaproteobacteria bacterium]|jgi:hypothetical protein
MKKSTFPIVAMFIGLILVIILVSMETAAGQFSAPLLMLMFMSELGFFVTGAGAFIGVKLQIEKGLDIKLLLWTLCCSVLAIVLALKGYAIWEYINAG